jgi:outer membrane receptor protein involved in Fe transport
LLAGARVDRRRLTADSNATLALSSQARDYTAVSGDAGVVYRPVPALSVAANVGRAWRAPTLFELFANGAHPGEARYEIGRPDLVAEVGTNVDVSVRWQGRRLHAEAAGYRNAIARYVFITPTNEFRDSLRVYRYEQADALLTGAEVTMDAEVRAPLALRARFDAVRGTNRSTGEPLPLVPPARAALGAELRMASLRWADRALIAAEVEVVTRQTRLNPLDVPTAGYALLNVEAGIDRPLFGRAGRIDLSVRNATNVAYKSFLSRYKEFALDPGRSVIVRVSVGE